MNTYEVIIVGAGPGGLSCAQVLLEAGISVLVLEKDEFPLDKNCGGGLTFLAGDLNLPEGISRSFEHTSVQIGNTVSTVKFKKPLVTVPRKDLFLFQLDKVGTENVHFKEKVVKIYKDKVVTDKGEYSYRFLVGADGSNSIVAKFLGVKPDLSIGVNANVNKIVDEPLWFVGSSTLGSGYHWIFPHKEFTSIGVYRDRACDLKEKDMQFLKEKIRDLGVSPESADIRTDVVNTGYSGVCFKNIFLVGDAAGLALKSTGEGIPGALISGSEVACRILDHNYRMSRLRDYLLIKKRQDMFARVLRRIPFLKDGLLKAVLMFKKVVNY